MRSLLFFTLIFFIPKFLASPVNRDTTSPPSLLRSPTYAPHYSSPKSPTVEPSNADASTLETYYYTPKPPGSEFDPTRRRSINPRYEPEVGDVIEILVLPDTPMTGKSRKIWTLVIAGRTGTLIYECLLFLFDKDKSKPEGQEEYWEQSVSLFSSHQKKITRGGVRYTGKSEQDTRHFNFNVFKFKPFTINVANIVNLHIVKGIGNEQELGRIMDLIKSPPSYSKSSEDRIFVEDDAIQVSPRPPYPQPAKQPNLPQRILKQLSSFSKSKSGSSTDPRAALRSGSGGPSSEQSVYTGEPLQRVASPDRLVED